MVAGGACGYVFEPVYFYFWFLNDAGAKWLNGCVYICRPLLLLVVVARSKLVPDFALTLHGVHLALTWAWSGAVPGNGLWWGLQAASAALMVGGGVWCCRWRELRPIAFGGGGGKGKGKGEGEGGDTGGEYEMVGRVEEGEGEGGGVG